MRIKKIAALTVSVTTAIALAACSTDTEADTNNGTTPATSTDKTVADQVTDALDKLNVEWDNLTDHHYNAAANSDVRDLNIGGHDAGIHEFRTEESAKDWSDASDSLGGIHVAFANSAVSLNSKEGREASEELAPRLAEALNGEAHIADDPFAAFDDLDSILDEPAPTVTETVTAAPEPAASPTATCALDPIYEAGTTFYSDGTSGFTTACYDEFITTNGTGNNYVSPNVGGDPSTWGYDGPRTENGDPAEHPQAQWSNCLAEYGLEYCQENDPSGY